MRINKFMNNWSLMWGLGRYEIRLWCKYPWKIEYINYGHRLNRKLKNG